MRKTKLKEPLTLEQRNKNVRVWLNQHDLFNRSAICRRIYHNRGAFGHFEEGHVDLSEQVLERLHTALIPYGYDENENFGN